MKILHFGTLDMNYGGPAMSTYLTLVGIGRKGVDVRLAMYPFTGGVRLVGKDVKTTYMREPIEHRFCYSPSLKNELMGLGSFDVYHVQGIWQYPTYALVDVAKRQGKPYIITPRGMLYPQDIAKRSTLFKKLSLKFRLLRDLNNAACVHVTCDEEMKYCRDLGVTSPIAVIPNPVEIKEYPYKKEDKVRRIGYLGRLSPRKNVEGLIKAFADLGDEAIDAELLVVGGGDESYERFLHQEVEKYHLNNVSFTGFLSGDEKDRAIASCSVLAMPSEFENFGNVVAEGLVRGVPCIATTGSPWSELLTEHCGWWVPYSQEDITNAVRSALNVTQDKLDILGANGRRLMEEKYSVQAIAQKMKDLYSWIINGTHKPSFLYDYEQS